MYIEKWVPCDPPRKARTYGLSNFVGDLTLTILTCGLWAIWWIIREVTR